jgi:Nif-specific regulatory protein
MKNTFVSEPSKIEIFSSVAKLLDSSRDIDEVLGKIIETAVATLEARASSLIMVKDKRLRFFMATGDTRRELQNLDLGMGEGIAGWVASNKTPLLVQDVEKDYRWSSKISEVTGFKVHSIACCPLLIQNEVVGVLEILDRKDGSPLDEVDLEKLVSFAKLAETIIEDTTKIRTIAVQNEYLKKEIASRYHLVGESPNFKKVLKEAEKLARTNATCIIVGESGTGKELIARYIYRMSGRSDQSFIAANCGALPETILERELFGHEKGAFTGADRRQIGIFEAADNGTIFLDEVSEMTLTMQVKFLRVIEERQFYRLGGTSPININVRIVAATNRSLEQLISEGKFREDLYYRLNVVKLSLPPLRERREDIPLLVDFFLKKQDIVPLSRNTKVSDEAMEYLKKYSWPGNVRELENAIERALVMAETDELQISDFPLHPPERKSDGIPVGCSLKNGIDHFKKEFIKKTLASANGSRTEAARILEIERTYLSKLTKELEIP